MGPPECPTLLSDRQMQTWGIRDGGRILLFKFWRQPQSWAMEKFYIILRTVTGVSRVRPPSAFRDGWRVESDRGEEEMI